MADNSVYFNFDNNGDKPPKKDERTFEDILSNSAPQAYTDISSTSGGKHYAKKKSGLLAWGEKVGIWWHKQHLVTKIAITLAALVAALAAFFVIWKFVPVAGRWKLMVCSVLLAAFVWAFYIIIPWRHRKTQLTLSVIASVVLAVLLLISIFWDPFHRLIYNYDTDFPSHKEDLGVTEQIDKKIINIALFGIDTRNTDSFKGNSDSIMILSLNTEKNSVKIVSVMRDSLVPIEKSTGKTYFKINAAYAWGNAELAVKTLNTVFGLDITEYATVNFFGMAKIIDAVGGIDAELTEREVGARGENNHGINDMISEVCGLTGLKAADYYVRESGPQHLNGIQAVAYSRIRYVANIWGTNNDYGRTERQRYVMEQLFNKAIQMKKSDYPKLVRALIPYAVTSLSMDEVLELAFDVLLDSPTFSQARLPVDNSQMPSPSGPFGSVVYYDVDYAAKLVHAFFYDDITFDDYIAAHPIEKNNWYAKIGGGSSRSSGTVSHTETVSDVPQTTSEPTDSQTDSQTESTDSSATQSTESETSSANTSSEEKETSSKESSETESKTESSDETSHESEGDE